MACLLSLHNLHLLTSSYRGSSRDGINLKTAKLLSVMKSKRSTSSDFCQTITIIITSSTTQCDYCLLNLTAWLVETTPWRWIPLWRIVFLLQKILCLSEYNTPDLRAFIVLIFKRSFSLDRSDFLSFHSSKHPRIHQPTYLPTHPSIRSLWPKCVVKDLKANLKALEKHIEEQDPYMYTLQNVRRERITWSLEKNCQRIR